MWFGFAPTKEGTPVSRSDRRASVVDTGTQRDETARAAVTDIRCIREKGLDS